MYKSPLFGGLARLKTSLITFRPQLGFNLVL